MAEPDRISGVYMTYFRAKGESADKDVADEVILWCGGASTTFRLPRHHDLFEDAKKMLATAYQRGRESMASDLRDLLNVKEYSCDEN